MDQRIADWLANGPLVTDGGWGTQLQLRGLPQGTAPELWNLTEPEKVQAVAASYVEAGSDIILTNTFGGNRFLLARHDKGDQTAEINRRGVEISRQAADKASRKVLVFASIGPTGVLLMAGTETPESLYEAFCVQAEALCAGGADALVVETMSDPAEAAAAVRAAKTTGLPVVACMTFDSGKKKDRTMMGTTPEQAAEALTAAGADCLGSNCGQGIDGFVPLTQRMREVTSLPLWMKGNAGLPEMVDGKTVYRQTPERFAERGAEILDAGASFIGGCCGTTPEYVRELRKLVDSRK